MLVEVSEMARSATYHGRVRKASTRTAKAKKAKDVRQGRRARTHGVNVRKGF